jgi:hypothetical protein
MPITAAAADREYPPDRAAQAGRHRVLQERPEPPHGHQLEREPGLHVVTAPQIDRRPILVVEEEHPLEVRLRRRPGYRPYAASSSVRNSTGMDRKV